MWRDFKSRFALARQVVYLRRWVACALAIALSYSSGSAICQGEEVTVRLRFAWGNGAAAKQRWTGQITIEAATLTDLQPLGIEPDEPASLRVAGNRLIVSPRLKRGFDGCDVTVHAEEQAGVRIELRSDEARQPTVVEATLAQLKREQLRMPLDALGSFVLAHRSPGDKLRVIVSRQTLVFQPTETWNLRLEPDLREELAQGPVQLNLQLRAVGNKKILWQTDRLLNPDSTDNGQLDFDIACPEQEGAYRLTITAHGLESFASRWVPGYQAKRLASREVEFVVVDPAAQLPRLTDRWLPVLAVDPASPSWWQRLPSWARVPRLPGLATGTSGNIRPVVRSSEMGELVELPPAATQSDPYWQAYTLPVRRPGTPHLVEIEYPIGQRQHLAISIVEPNAAGQVVTSRLDSGFYTEHPSSKSPMEVGVHRIVFWPRTRSPQLLLVNRHPSARAQYGKIRLLRHDDQTPVSRETSAANANRLIAGYISKPMFADNFGAAEILDPHSGLSVHGWSTFLEGANRLAQYLRLSGYNSVLVSVAADGSALYPSKHLLPSPRYDTGLLAAGGQDPSRKDVLEMLLRVFDREGLRVVPTLQLAAPLPRLEEIRRAGNPQRTGIEWVGQHGRSWLEENPTISGLAPYYNLLNEQVRAEVIQLVSELVDRYGKHSSLAGVALQLSGEGYGVLPDLTWGMDDQTIADFSQATGIQLADEGPDRFRRRAEQLSGPHREAWRKWRVQKLSGLYAKLAEVLTAERQDLQLVLATEDVFTGPAMQRRVRQAISNPESLDQVLLDHGLDWAQLDEAPGIVALLPTRLGPTDRLQQRALDLRINTATQQGELLPLRQQSAALIYHTASRFSLPSFDERNPLNASQTHLSLTSQPLPAGAAQRQSLIQSLARNDVLTVVQGGPFLPLTLRSRTRQVLLTLQQLPVSQAAVHTQVKQPVVLRVYRQSGATTVSLINEAPWPVSVRLPIDALQRCDWRKLGDAAPTAADPTHGTLVGGSQEWQVELQPYDLQAWNFSTEKLRVGKPLVSLDASAQADLEQRIQAIESRTGNLKIQRPYSRLLNPGFELEDPGVPIVGWQIRRDQPGAVDLDAKAPYSGKHALHLKSEDATGVAVQSHLFPMPETGQLVMVVHVRGQQVDPEARLYLSFEDGEGGRRYRQFTTLGGARLLEKEWSWYEFPVNDIPLDTDGQMRVQFHLTGRAEVFIDDVQLFDLQFEDARRVALVKRVYAAKTALDEGQVIDCLRLVDEYWSRYLVEHVPPLSNAAIQVAQAPQPPETKADDQEQHPGLAERIRGFIPRLWR